MDDGIKEIKKIIRDVEYRIRELETLKMTLKEGTKQFKQTVTLINDNKSVLMQLKELIDGRIYQ